MIEKAFHQDVKFFWNFKCLKKGGIIKRHYCFQISGYLCTKSFEFQTFQTFWTCNSKIIIFKCSYHDCKLHLSYTFFIISHLKLSIKYIIHFHHSINMIFKTCILQMHKRVKWWKPTRSKKNLLKCFSNTSSHLSRALTQHFDSHVFLW